MSSDMDFDCLKLSGRELEYLRKKCEADKQKIKERARKLVNTSVQDMKSTLDCAEATGDPYQVQILRVAFAEVTRRGEKTKANILQARIRRYEREGM